MNVESENLYTFTQLDTIVISPRSTLLMKLTFAIIAFHGEQPQGIQSYMDNGNDDDFSEDDFPPRCFWCGTTVTNNYFPGLCRNITTTNMFWGAFSHESIGESYGC